MCGLEFPDLEILDQERDELFVIGLAGSDDEDTLEAFVAQTGVRFPIAWDDGLLRNQVSWPQALSPYPRQLVVDRDGVLVYVASEHRLGDLEAAIDEALGR